jgi:cobalt/nickel transport system permease protein
MLNFPVVGGTSGHLLGSALIAILLGPGAAVVVMTTVLVVQCFLFADGGVLALGANVFNMAILGTIAGLMAFNTVAGRIQGLRGQVTAVAFAGWCSVVVASLGCAGQLAWSGTVAWEAAFPAMAGIPMLIGLGEGLISALVFVAVARTRPELIGVSGSDARPWRSWVLYGLLMCLGLAVFVAPFASSWPDGLEAVAARLGFEEHAVDNVVPAPAPDYEVPGIPWAVGATAVAGLVGSLLVFGLAWWLGRLLVPKPRAPAPNPPPRT